MVVEQIGRIKSTHDVMFEKLGDPRVDVIQLKLNGGQLFDSLLLEQVIRKSHEFGLGQPYNTKSANCTTEAFDRIDDVPRLRAPQTDHGISTTLHGQTRGRGLVRTKSKMSCLVNTLYGFILFTFSCAKGK